MLQEFVSLVGLESRCQGNSAVQLRAGDSDTQSAAPCSSSCLEASSEASSVLESRHVQECQKQAGMAAAVEAMLREVGEDPNREVCPCLLTSHMQMAISSSLYK